MSRLPMPGAMPADLAERLSDVDVPLTFAQQAAIDRLAYRKLRDRLYRDTPAFNELTDSIPSADIGGLLQQALREVEAAAEGSRSAIQEVIEAVLSIRRVYMDKAQTHWLDDLRDEAEVEILGIEP